MPTLPTDRTTASTAAEHVADHNTVHTLNNQLGSFTQSASAPGSPATGDLWLDTDEVAQSSTSLGVLPGGYATTTTTQSGVTTVTDATGLSVTVTTLAGRLYQVRGWALMQGSASTCVSRLSVQEGATVLALDQFYASAASEQGLEPKTPPFTPSAGSHTYKLTLERAAGSGSVARLGDATYRSFIVVEDIGAA